NIKPTAPAPGPTQHSGLESFSFNRWHGGAVHDRFLECRAPSAASGSRAAPGRSPPSPRGGAPRPPPPRGPVRPRPPAPPPPLLGGAPPWPPPAGVHPPLPHPAPQRRLRQIQF